MLLRDPDSPADRRQPPLDLDFENSVLNVKIFIAQEYFSVNCSSAMMALHLNLFIFIVQMFQKVPVLKAVAPTQSEPPFLITQLVVLVLFVAGRILAVTRFRNEQLRTA